MKAQLHVSLSDSGACGCMTGLSVPVDVGPVIEFKALSHATPLVRPIPQMPGPLGYSLKTCSIYSFFNFAWKQNLFVKPLLMLL